MQRDRKLQPPTRFRDCIIMQPCSSACSTPRLDCSRSPPLSQMAILTQGRSNYRPSMSGFRPQAQGFNHPPFLWRIQQYNPARHCIPIFVHNLSLSSLTIRNEEKSGCSWSRPGANPEGEALTSRCDIIARVPVPRSSLGLCFLVRCGPRKTSPVWLYRYWCHEAAWGITD